MKYLKKFENFYSEDEEIIGSNCEPCDSEDGCCPICHCEVCECDEDSMLPPPPGRDENAIEQPEDHTQRNITLEKKKLPAGLRNYLNKKKGGKAAPKEEGKKSEKEGKEESKGSKGLTAKQKKLPPGLQKAILSRKK